MRSDSTDGQSYSHFSAATAISTEGGPCDVLRAFLEAVR
jgi:hypothetical protein